MQGNITACIEVQNRRSEPTATLKGEDLATHGFLEKFTHTHTLNPLRGEPSFTKVISTPCRTRDAFPTHL